MSAHCTLFKLFWRNAILYIRILRHENLSLRSRVDSDHKLSDHFPVNMHYNELFASFLNCMSPMCADTVAFGSVRMCRWTHHCPYFYHCIVAIQLSDLLYQTELNRGLWIQILDGILNDKPLIWNSSQLWSTQLLLLNSVRLMSILLHRHLSEHAMYIK